jgi:predicted phosphodiesterase
MKKSVVAKEYRNKYGKDMPTLKLARMMYKENNLLFKDVEDARCLLRYIEGKSGQKSKKAQDKTYHLDYDRPKNPYNLPKSDETTFEPFVLKGYKKIALLSDIHVPYHSIEAITTSLNFIKKEKPDLLILNGDTLDFFQLSRFGKDPKKRSFAYELDTMKELIQIFQKQLKCKIVFKKGNHEERYQHFLNTKAGELVGVEEFDLVNIIKARAEGIEVIGEKRIIHANKLNIIHGHEFSQGFFSPVNIARGLALRAKASAIQGHNHQTSEHTQIDINGKVMTTWSTGCLCELHPHYAPINNWNHGFAIIDLDANGEDFQVRNKRIYKGKIL